MSGGRETTFGVMRKRVVVLAEKLAELYGRPAGKSLHMVEADEADDSLLVVAVLGGKEVGKTTLINALAGQDVAGEKFALRGTSEITAYLHRDARRECEGRLVGCGPVELHTHELKPLRHLVLLDMPDFDSDFLDHFEIVRHTLPKLDRVIWLVSHEKYANRSLVDLLRRCGQNPGNFLFVLNKLDLVAAAEGPETVEGMTRDFADKLARQLNGDGDLKGRVFGISAQLKKFDFGRLSSAVFAPVDVAEVQRVRETNRAYALAADLETLHESYPLAGDLEELEKVGASLSEAGGELATAWERSGRSVLTERPGLADEWGREVYRVRIATWPVLSLPFGPLLLLLGKLLGLRSLRLDLKSEHDPEGAAGAVLDGGPMRAVEAVSACWHSVRQGRPELSALLCCKRPYPWQPEACETVVEEVRGALAEQIAGCEDELVGACKRKARRGAALRWVMLLIPLLWFPIVQPILAASLETAARPDSFSGWMRLAYTAVILFGATHWLKSIGVLLAVYGLMALAVYARARWTARRFLRKQLLSRLRPLLAERIEAALRGPVDARSALLRPARDELEEIGLVITRSCPASNESGS